MKRFSSASHKMSDWFVNNEQIATFDIKLPNNSHSNQNLLLSVKRYFRAKQEAVVGKV